VGGHAKPGVGQYFGNAEGHDFSKDGQLTSLDGHGWHDAFGATDSHGLCGHVHALTVGQPFGSVVGHTTGLVGHERGSLVGH
jgi:hypothetical protein